MRHDVHSASDYFSKIKALGIWGAAARRLWEPGEGGKDKRRKQT